MQTKTIEKYFFFGLLLSTLLFTFLIFRPFWIVLVLGISFSIVLYPVHEWLLKKNLPRSFSAFLTLLLFVLVLCGPLLGIGTIVFTQSEEVYQKVINKGDTGPFVDSLEKNINKILPPQLSIDVGQRAKDFISYVSSNVTSIFTATISAFFSFLLILLIIFYCLKDGAEWRKSIIMLSPLGDKDDEKIIKRLAEAVNGIIKGSLLISMIQGILMGIGLWIFGIPNGALWGMVAAITSLIPTLGTALVSIPAIIFLFATGHIAQTIGLLIWSSIMVGMIDNLLGPVIVSKKIRISSLLILFSVLGGISLLGPVGVLVGPLTLSFLYTLVSIYRNELKENEGK